MSDAIVLCDDALVYGQWQRDRLKYREGVSRVWRDQFLAMTFGGSHLGKLYRDWAVGRPTMHQIDRMMEG